MLSEPRCVAVVTYNGTNKEIDVDNVTLPVIDANQHEWFSNENNTYNWLNMCKRMVPAKRPKPTVDENGERLHYAPSMTDVFAQPKLPTVRELSEADNTILASALDDLIVCITREKPTIEPVQRIKARNPFIKNGRFPPAAKVKTNNPQRVR